MSHAHKRAAILGLQVDLNPESVRRKDLTLCPPVPAESHAVRRCQFGKDSTHDPAWADLHAKYSPWARIHRARLADPFRYQLRVHQETEHDLRRPRNEDLP